MALQIPEKCNVRCWFLEDSTPTKLKERKKGKRREQNRKEGRTEQKEERKNSNQDLSY